MLPHKRVLDLCLAWLPGAAREARGWLMMFGFLGLFWATWTMTPWR
jgi:hypothetical protein